MWQLSQRLLLLVLMRALPDPASAAVQDTHRDEEAHDHDAQREEHVREVLRGPEPAARWLCALQQDPPAATLYRQKSLCCAGWHARTGQHGDGRRSEASLNALKAHCSMRQPARGEGGGVRSERFLLRALLEGHCDQSDGLRPALVCGCTLTRWLVSSTDYCLPR